MTNHIDSFRQIPRQARSKVTVDAILEATARILQTDGPRAATTNAIARIAGVSIGTLYQYFPNKNAILIALARKELAITGQDVSTNISNTAQTGGLEESLRASIRALIQGFKGRLHARKALIEALIAAGLVEELTLPVDNVMKDIIAAGSREGNSTFSEIRPVTAYVLTRAIIGTIRSSVMEESAYFGTREFEDELVKLASVLLEK